MEQISTKCVMIMDKALPAGILANASAILGITLGKLIPECVGENVVDGSGYVHKGIITIPVPILKSDAESLKALREMLFTEEFSDLTVVDFSDVAQCCNVYDEYIQNAAHTKEEDHTYLGIAIYGPKKKVNKLSGSMPLLR